MNDEALVLDASIAVAWFFANEPMHLEALTVRGRVSDNPSMFLVPALFYSELVHVLARKSGGDASFVEEALGLVLRFGLRTLTLSDLALRRTPYWCCKGLGGYDATYVALAEDIGGRWLTADERGVRVAGPKQAVGLRDLLS